MDLSQDILMETILNIVSYLAATGLLLTLYSLLRGRKKAASVSTTYNLKSTDNKSGRSRNASSEQHRIEFIRLGEQPDNADNTSTGKARPKDAPMTMAASRRNRIEVVRLARKMIEAGAPAERIRAVLPISEAELTLLSYQAN